MAARERGMLDDEAVLAVQAAMITHCELMADRVAILDTPRGLNAQASAKFAKEKGLPYVLTPKQTFDSFGSDFGIGVRLDLPIGPLRLDYGYPLNRAGNTGHGHLNFSVGYQF